MRGGMCVWYLGILFSWLRWAQGQSQTNFTRPVFLCSGHLVADSGFVASEGFPSYYKPNSKCTWYITVPEGHVVMLQFRVFDLEADPTCRYDYLDVYNGHSYMVQKLGRFCGTFRPGALISTSNTMMLEMVSDAGTGGRGFVAYYSAGKPHVDEEQFCGGRLTKPQGSVKTPNWPDTDYPSGISCSWHISMEPNMVLEVKFEKLDLESDIYCRYDYVALFNGGERDDSRRIGKFCGHTIPEEIVTNGNELLVQFVSDLSVTGAGFILHYNSVPQSTRRPTTHLDSVTGPRVDARPATPPRARPTPRPAPTPKPPAPKPSTRPGGRPAPRRPLVIKPTPKPRPARPARPTLKPRPTPKPRPARPTPKPRPARPTPKPRPAQPTPKPRPTPRPPARVTPKPRTRPTPKPKVKPTPKPKVRPVKPTPKPKVKPKAPIKATPKPKAKVGPKPPSTTSTKAIKKINPICPRQCKRSGTLFSSYCPSQFVLTGKVTSQEPGPEGSVKVEVSIIKAYKADRLNVTKRGPTTSVTLTLPCSKCPALRKGVNYVLMGDVSEDGSGVLSPTSFILLHKAVHNKALASLAKKPC